MARRVFNVKIELVCKGKKLLPQEVRKAMKGLFDDFQEDSLKIKKLTVKEMSRVDRREEI